MILKIGDKSRFALTPLSLYLKAGIPSILTKSQHFVNLELSNSLRQCQVETRAKKLRSLSPAKQRQNLSEINWRKPELWFVGADYSHPQLDIIGAWFIQEWLISAYKKVEPGRFNGEAKFHTLNGTYADELRDNKKYPNMLVLSGIWNGIEASRRGKILDILGATNHCFRVILIRGSDPLAFAYNELSHLAARYLYINPEWSQRAK